MTVINVRFAVGWWEYKNENGKLERRPVCFYLYAWNCWRCPDVSLDCDGIKGEKMIKHAFGWSVFGFICGLIATTLGIVTQTPFTIIIGIVGMIGNAYYMFRFQND